MHNTNRHPPTTSQYIVLMLDDNVNQLQEVLDLVYHHLPPLIYIYLCMFYARSGQL